MNAPDEPLRPVLRVVRGNASPEDVAVLTALVSAIGGDDAPAARERRGGWSDPGMLVRPSLRPGPNGWRSSLR